MSLLSQPLKLHVPNTRAVRCSATTSRQYGTKFIGCGSSVPKQVIHNDDLRMLNTSDEWIRPRTGIRERRVVSGQENMTMLAVAAGKEALRSANVSPEDVDCVLLCTSSQDNRLGSSPAVMEGLGCTNGVALDLTAACSGFVAGLTTASFYLRGGGFNTVLVIGADTLSRFADWDDRKSCVLFGDGAGAVVMQATSQENDNFLGFHMETLPSADKYLRVPVDTEKGVKKTIHGCAGTVDMLLKPPFSFLHMDGTEVFQVAVQTVPRVVKAALRDAGIGTQDVDWLLLHQANKRIIDKVAEKLQVPAEKVITNIERYGNTSAGSIPLALDEFVKCGRIKDGDVIIAAGFGAGFTCVCGVFKWGTPSTAL